MNRADDRSIDTLLSIMAALRDPAGGCPWDREQDFGSIAPYTIEEAYEVADAIDRDDLEDLRQELGDLLFQVVFHARMAEELGAFDFGGVVAAITAKMIRRHPHVFGDAQLPDANAQREAWESLKEEERRAVMTGRTSLVDGIGLALPALTRAEKLGRRAGRVGFDWPDATAVIAKLREELDEVVTARDEQNASAVADEVGDLLFSVVNLARHLRIDPEEALRGANRKFESRFRLLEARIASSGKDWSDFTPAELEAYWQQAKAGR